MVSLWVVLRLICPNAEGLGIRRGVGKGVMFLWAGWVGFGVVLEAVALSTLQVPDMCVYDGVHCTVMRLSGTGFYTPGDFGLTPYSTTNSCWRGYMFIYLCEAEALYLNQILVNAKTPPAIGGVPPEPFKGMFEYWYRNLRLKERGTGHLLIGQGQDRSKLKGRLYPLPVDYARILRISVEKGDIVNVVDHADWAGRDIKT